MIEEFRDIVGYEGLYQVSNLGNVKSLPREIKGNNNIRLSKERILKACINKGRSGGYERYILVDSNGYKKNYSGHYLVVTNFIGNVDYEKNMVIDHIDGDKLNNHVNNLRIVTTRENTTICFRKNKHEMKTKYIGVTKCKNHFIGKIYIKEEECQIYLGQYKTAEEANDIYNEALNNYLNGDWDIFYNELLLKIKRSKNKTSIYKGVYWNKILNKWRVEKSINNKRYNVGCYTDELEAYNAYLNFK